MFSKINTNPHQVTTYDCIIRALSLFMNTSYNKVLEELLRIYVQTGYHIGDPVCFMLFLKKFPNIVPTILPKDSRPLLKDMCANLENHNYQNLPNITNTTCHKILVFCGNNHLTYLQDSVIMDTWNCECLQVSSYYTYEEPIQ